MIFTHGSKLSEHGGSNEDDVHTALLVSLERLFERHLTRGVEEAFAGRDGTLYILYRAATRKVERGMQLLTSRDHGRTFQARALDRWRVDT